jgi:hypothetical protein
MIVLRGPTTRSGRPGEKAIACPSLLLRIDSWKATSVPFIESRQMAEHVRLTKNQYTNDAMIRAGVPGR